MQSQNYSKGEVLAFVNAVLYGNDFARLTDEQKEKNITGMANTPLLVGHGITRNDIVTMYQKNYTSGVFAQLGRDPLFLILQRAAPKDVLSLCSSTPALAQLCRDERVFSQLLQIHFPSASINVASPKEQFKALVLGKQTYYLVYLYKHISTGLGVSTSTVLQIGRAHV